MPLNNRQHALLAYFATIAADPKVLRALANRSLDDAVVAVGGCIRADLPAVLEHMGYGLLRGVVRRVQPVAEDFLGRGVAAILSTLQTPEPVGREKKKR